MTYRMDLFTVARPSGWPLPVASSSKRPAKSPPFTGYKYSMDLVTYVWPPSDRPLGPLPVASSSKRRAKSPPPEASSSRPKRPRRADSPLPSIEAPHYLPCAFCHGPEESSRDVPAGYLGTEPFHEECVQTWLTIGVAFPQHQYYLEAGYRMLDSYTSMEHLEEGWAAANLPEEMIAQLKTQTDALMIRTYAQDDNVEEVLNTADGYSEGRWGDGRDRYEGVPVDADAAWKANHPEGFVKFSAEVMTDEQFYTRHGYIGRSRGANINTGPPVFLEGAPADGGGPRLAEYRDINLGGEGTRLPSLRQTGLLEIGVQQMGPSAQGVQQTRPSAQGVQPTGPSAQGVQQTGPSEQGMSAKKLGKRRMVEKTSAEMARAEMTAQLKAQVDQLMIPSYEQDEPMPKVVPMEGVEMTAQLGEQVDRLSIRPYEQDVRMEEAGPSSASGSGR